MCEACELDDECECVPCRSCGHNTPLDEIWRGICGSCEDEQMVRSIM